MPEDLLQELEAANAAAGSLDCIEDLARAVRRHAPQVSLAAESMKGSALAFQSIWRRIVVAVANGQTAELHAARSRLLDAFDKRLGQLKDTHNLAKWLCMLGCEDVPAPDALLPEIDAMERLRTTVFDRWETADDLETLAARDYPLATAELERIGPQRRPAASYYNEESKPF
jgi:hypothetical protein